MNDPIKSQLLTYINQFKWYKTNKQHSTIKCKN